MDELKALLPEALAGSDAFALYLLSFPNMLTYARFNLAMLREHRVSTVPAEIEAARDAANNLFMIAQEAGFLLAAAVFYASYEQLCRKLLSWYPGF